MITLLTDPAIKGSETIRECKNDDNTYENVLNISSNVISPNNKYLFSQKNMNLLFKLPETLGLK